LEIVVFPPQLTPDNPTTSPCFTGEAAAAVEIASLASLDILLDLFTGLSLVLVQSLSQVESE